MEDWTTKGEEEASSSRDYLGRRVSTTSTSSSSARFVVESSSSQSVCRLSVASEARAATAATAAAAANVALSPPDPPTSPVSRRLARTALPSTSPSSALAATPSTATARRAKFDALPNARVETGFAHYGPRMRLYCRTGFCLTILPDGNVVGDGSGNHVNGVLEFTSAGIGEVRIRGVEANLYLAMNGKGNLYGQEDGRDYGTVFVESVYGQYNTYLSHKYAHRGWYVGIKKSGAIKNAFRTRYGQKAVQFLPIRA